MLTIMGFLVGLALSFRNATAYERYNDGRKYWSQLTLTCDNLARVIWVHAVEREDHAKEDLLAKM
jgi:putative membrane protein